MLDVPEGIASRASFHMMHETARNLLCPKKEIGPY